MGASLLKSPDINPFDVANETAEDPLLSQSLSKS